MVFHQVLFDRVATIILAIFGTMNWLAFGLHLQWMQEPMSFLISLGGLLQPVPSEFAYSFGAMLGGNFAAGIAAINIQAILQGFNEDEGTAAARQDANMVTLVGFILVFVDAISAGFVSGSFVLWNMFFAVLTFGYYSNVIAPDSEEGSIRHAINSAFFKRLPSSTVDAIISIVIIAFGSIVFLVIGLHLDSLQSALSAFMDLFGLLGPKPDSYDCDNITALGAGAWSLGMVGLNLSVFSAAEPRAYAEVRRLGNLMFWGASFVDLVKFLDDGSFYSFWILTTFTAFHLLLGMRSDLVDKLKGRFGGISFEEQLWC